MTESSVLTGDQRTSMTAGYDNTQPNSPMHTQTGAMMSQTGGPLALASGGGQAGMPAHMQAVATLFTRIGKEIEVKNPSNPIHFIVDFLCKNYSEHLHGFASIWNADPELEQERQEVVQFFKHHKISTQISAHFTNAGYDTLETLATLTTDTLVDIESFNSVKWLPGHKVRLQQVFSDIGERVREFRQRQPISGGASFPHQLQADLAAQQQAMLRHSYMQQQMLQQHQAQQTALAAVTRASQQCALPASTTSTSSVVPPATSYISSSGAPIPTSLPPTPSVSSASGVTSSYFVKVEVNWIREIALALFQKSTLTTCSKMYIDTRKCCSDNDSCSGSSRCTDGLQHTRNSHIIVYG
ncbi:unnamed protein product [Amoebophrya sp. A25]|nr:unnamed protein product [Amoebophrya sp. A25]|eukprot:GSA25T00021999001.1